MTYTYSVYGLIINLPFPCPLLTPAPHELHADINVLDGQVMAKLAAPIAEGPGWQVEPGRYLFRAGSRAGRFLAEDGCRATLQRGPAAQDDLLATSFLDNVLVALLRQRGSLVLHANTALTSRGAIAISGESGAGKSTTLTALLQQGCAMLADDITVLQVNPIGQLEVLPGIPQLNLMEDAAHNLGYDISQFPRHQWQPPKAMVPMHSQMSLHPARLRALYLLQRRPIEEIRVRALNGAEKFFAAQSCVYGPMLPDEHPGVFPLFAALVDQVPIFCIERPLDRWSLSAVINNLLETDG